MNKKMVFKAATISIIISLLVTIVSQIPTTVDLIGSGIGISSWFSLDSDFLQTGGCKNGLCMDIAVNTIAISICTVRLIALFVFFTVYNIWIFRYISKINK